jgi:hypothetical protein
MNVVVTIKCPTCNGTITDRMAQCPYCGSDLYYTRKPGTDNVARVGDKVVVVRHEPVHVPSYSSQKGGQEYQGKGGTFTRPSVGFGQVLFPTEEEVEEWNNESRRRDDERARPALAKLIYFITLCMIFYIIYMLGVILF